MFSLLGRGVSSVLQSVVGSGGGAAVIGTGGGEGFSDTEKEQGASKQTALATVDDLCAQPISIPEDSRLSEFYHSVGQKTAQPVIPIPKTPLTSPAATNTSPSSVTEQSGSVLSETENESDMGRTYIGAGTRSSSSVMDLRPIHEEGDTMEGIGVVTVLEELMPKGVIDGHYFFNKDCCAPEIKRGSKVHFRATKTLAMHQWEVQFLKLYISPEELEKKELRKCKSVVGRICRISHGTVFLQYGKGSEEVQEIPLQMIHSGLGYPPWEGDYLRVKIEVDDPDDPENTMGRMLSVEPTQRKTVVGRLTQNRHVMTIENHIYFDASVCQNDRLPSPRDCVCAVAVEWTQGNERCTWRAISVTPSNFYNYASSSKESEDWLETENSWTGPLLELQREKYGVRIEPKKGVAYGGVKIGSTLIKSVEVHNSSENTVALKSVTVQGDQSVCAFRAEFERRESTEIIAMILPSSTFTCRVSCIPAMLGSTRELLVFDFGNFRIGRYVTVTGLSTEEGILQEIKVKDVANGKGRQWQQVRSDETLEKMIQDDKRQVVRGVQPIRSPFFLSKRLELNSVPKCLWKIVKDQDEQELVRQYPGVLEELRIQNYLEKFKVSLWLEEMENDILRRQYDMNHVILRPAGEQYTFEAPGLKDFHPPVLVGDPISVYDSSDESNMKYEAFILDIRGNDIYAKFSEQFRLKYDGTFVTVQFRLGRTTYKRGHHAVDQAVKLLGEEWLFPEMDIPIKPARIPFLEADDDVAAKIEALPETPSTESENGLKEKEAEAPEAQDLEKPVKSLNLFRGNKQAAPVHTRAIPFHASGRNMDRRVASMKQEFVSDTQGPDLKSGNMKLTWFNKMLNQEQRDAVRRILRGQGRPIPYIIFGPPGTGKTVTVVEAILQVHSMDRNSRILVVAPSNSAADVIAVHLAASKQFSPGDFVRLVGFLRQEAQIPETIRDYCNDGENLDTVARHRLIICTCSTAGQFFQLGLDSGHFTHVFVDEAGYCTEPEAVIAAVLVALDKSGQVILAGDPKQLGPVLMSDVASKCGLSLSLLERLMARPLYARNETRFPNEKYNPIALTKLVRNYRAHPTLLKLPSKLFYDDELVSAAADNDINLCHSLSFTKDKGVPLLFHGIQGTSSRDPDSPSWFNAAEVIEVVNYVRKLRAHGLSNDDIGIITPYRKQVEKLRRALEFGLLQDEIPKVGSVEEFQGGERKVMIMSLVRSVAEKQLEKVVDRLSFVFSPKRFNVAVTRAKAILIVIGNPHVLHHDPNWSTFLKYCIELGCYKGCNLPLDLDPVTQTYLGNLKSDDGPLPVELAKYDSDGDFCESDDDDDD